MGDAPTVADRSPKLLELDKRGRRRASAFPAGRILGQSSGTARARKTTSICRILPSPAEVPPQQLERSEPQLAESEEPKRLTPEISAPLG